MKSVVEIFTSLGDRLLEFGKNTDTQSVIDAAIAENGWFTKEEICCSIEAIRSQMLQPKPLKEWLEGYNFEPHTPLRTLIVMAGNIPAVGFFDMLCVLAAGDCAIIKPSSKDRVLIEYIIGLLCEIEPKVMIELYTDNTTNIEAVIATGSSNANRYFRSQFDNLPMLLRSNRTSVAVLNGSESEEQMARLADDIWAYSGLGCRNVSIIFIAKGSKLNLAMPTMNPKYLNNYRQQRALAAMNKTPYLDFGAAIGIEQRCVPATLSTISYSYYDTLDEVAQWLIEMDDEIQCVVSECIEHRRQVGIGKAQKPQLTDYADGIDTILWLKKLHRQLK